jgi:hypothetical protein
MKYEYCLLHIMLFAGTIHNYVCMDNTAPHRLYGELFMGHLLNRVGPVFICVAKCILHSIIFVVQCIHVFKRLPYSPAFAYMHLLYTTLLFFARLYLRHCN